MQADPAPPPPQFYPCLESLRSVCAIVVALFHVTWTSHLTGIAAMDRAWTFVDFFFVLSGFVIANAYIGSLRTAQDGVRFFIKRFFRLYPLHLLTMVAVGAVQFAGWKFAGTGDPFGENWRWLTFLNITLSHAIGLADGAIYNVPSWSISVELYAYLVFGLVCLACRRAGMIVFAIAVIAVLGGLAMVFDPQGNFLLTPSNSSLARGLFGFGIGVIVWAVQAKGGIRTSGWAGDGLVAALIALILAMMSWCDDRSPVLLALPLVYAVFILALIGAQDSHIRRALELRWFKQFGQVSYSLYMNHVFILIFVSFAVSRLFPGGQIKVAHATLHDVPLWAGDLAVLLFVVLLTLSSIVTYRFIETPGRTLGRNLAEKLRPPLPRGEGRL